ncbi:MAG: hypothetical protein ACM3H8_08600 [Sphingobacteriales bacterium]
MKKTFFLFLSVIVILFSCKKSDSGGSGNPTYYIKCKIDGTAKTFNYIGMAKITVLGPGATSLAIIGSAASGSSLEGVNLAVNFFNNVQPQANTTYSEDYGGTDYIAAGIYNPNSSTIVYGAGIYTPTALPFKLKIINKTATEMSGTFEGAFYKTDVSLGNITAEHVTITEGEFNLQIK